MSKMERKIELVEGEQNKLVVNSFHDTGIAMVLAAFDVFDDK